MVPLAAALAMVAGATCAHQSEASFPGAYRDAGNLTAGPLSMIGAARWTSAATVREFGGNKFPLLVRAGHRVTVAVSPGASLSYATSHGRRITFRACSAKNSQSNADGRPVTFWSGFVRVDEPMCVRLRIWIDGRTQPQRRRIALGRRC
jgi:hypothetical protein